MKKKFVVVAAFASISLASCSNGSSEKPVSDSGSTPKIQHSKEKPIKTGVYVGKDDDYGKESSVTIFEGEVEDCSGLVCESDVKFRQASDNSIVYTVPESESSRGETRESTNVFLCSDPKPDLKNFRCGPTGWIQSSIARPRIVDYITTQKEIRVVYSMDVDSCLDVDYERLNGCSSSAELSKLSAALGVFGGGSASKGSAERERARSEAWRACFRERPYNIPSGRLNAVLETGIRLVSKGDKSFYYTVYDDPEARATKKSYQKVECNFTKAIVEYSSSVSDKVDELEVSIGRNQF